MTGSMAPFFSIVSVTFFLLLLGIAIVSLRYVLRRRVQCPDRLIDAELVIEERKRFPWDHHGQQQVMRCSLQPGGVTCDRQCLQGNHR